MGLNKQLATVYLGTNYKRQEIDDFMKFEDVTCFEVVEDYTHKQTAEWLQMGMSAQGFLEKWSLGNELWETDQSLLTLEITR